MTDILYTATGDIVKLNTIEKFTDTPSITTDYLNLVGNLNLQGSINATSYLKDGKPLEMNTGSTFDMVNIKNTKLETVPKSEDLRIRNKSGYLDVGCKNTSGAHIYTNRRYVFFNKPISSTVDTYRGYTSGTLNIFPKKTSTKGIHIIEETATKANLQVDGDIFGETELFIRGNKASTKGIHIDKDGNVK